MANLMKKGIVATYYFLTSHSNASSLFPNTLWFFVADKKSITLNAADLMNPSPTKATNLM